MRPGGGGAAIVGVLKMKKEEEVYATLMKAPEKRFLTMLKLRINQTEGSTGAEAPNSPAVQQETIFSDLKSTL